MELNLDTGSGLYIQHYAPGCLRIHDKDYHHSVIIAPEHLQDNWPPACFTELHLQHCQSIIDLQPDIVLLGTGEHWHMPAVEFQLLFNKHHIGFESMDTAAACRTYNLLMAESRNVAAALLLN